MGDLLSHLVDAPLANILILAGLAFLGVAVIGKISGKIEPSTSGRVMAGILGLALLAYGSRTQSRRSRIPPKACSPAIGKTTAPTHAESRGWKFSRKAKLCVCMSGRHAHHKTVIGGSKPGRSTGVLRAWHGISRASCA